MQKAARQGLKGLRALERIFALGFPHYCGLVEKSDRVTEMHLVSCTKNGVQRTEFLPAFAKPSRRGVLARIALSLRLDGVSLPVQSIML